MPDILWAEDNSQDRRLIHAALQDIPGAPRVAFVEDGLVLLQELAKGTPRLVVLDLKMARLGGIEALRRMRAHPKRKDLPVVIFSSSSLPEEIAVCEQLGVLDYVQKPIDFDSFALAVERVVDYALIAVEAKA